MMCPQNCQRWQLYGHFLKTPKSVHRTAKVCSFVTGFPQLRKVSIKLPPFAVLGHNSEKCPQNCHRLQFCIMQNPHGETKCPKSVHKTAKVCSCMDTMHMNSEKCPQNCHGLQFWQVSIVLPPLAVLIHEKKCGQNCNRWQFYGHFLKLIYMAGVPTCLEEEEGENSNYNV